MGIQDPPNLSLLDHKQPVSSYLNKQFEKGTHIQGMPLRKLYYRSTITTMSDNYSVSLNTEIQGSKVKFRGGGGTKAHLQSK